MDTFEMWLLNKYSFNSKTVRDIASRLRRVKILCGKNNISSDLLSQLDKNSDFNKLSLSVKSQLRRSVKLYCEFIDYYDKK